MIRIAWSERVDRPSAEVFDYLADLDNESDWNPDASNAVRTSPEPIGRGAVWEQDFRRAGHVISTIEEFDPPRRLAFRVASPELDAEVRYEFTADGENATVVSCTIELTAKGLRRMLERLRWRGYRRRLERSRGQQLKRALER